MDNIEPATNMLYLPTLSENLPIIGPAIKVAAPVNIYINGIWSRSIPKLFTVNALPNGINIKPPVANNTVAAKPVKYRFLDNVIHKCLKGETLR